MPSLEELQADIVEAKDTFQAHEDKCEKREKENNKWKTGIENKLTELATGQRYLLAWMGGITAVIGAGFYFIVNILVEKLG